MSLVKDYGISTDETAQRYHSLVVFKRLFPRLTKDALTSDGIDFSKLPNVSEYENRYYGVAIQIPLVLIEAAFGFTLPIRTVFYIRHCYIFLLCFFSAIAVYGLMKNCFSQLKLVLLGVSAYIICPVVFASSFYNIKDNVCMSLSIISIYFLSEFFCSNRKKVSKLMYAITSALAVNSRVVTAVYVLLGLTCYFCFSISQNKVADNNASVYKNRVEYVLKHLMDVIVIGLLVLLFYYVFTPVLWEDTFDNLFGTVKTFSNYTIWKGQNLFMGEYISGDNLPWYYLPVSTVISLPLIYVIHIVCGAVFWIYSFVIQITNILANKHCNVLLRDAIADIFGGAVLIVFGYVMLCRPVLYTGWRHFYFLWPAYCYFIVYAVEKCICVFSVKKKVFKSIVLAPIVIAMSFTFVWMCINHPYEYVYYNYPTILYVNDNFERDYWGVSGRDAIEDLVTIIKPENVINVYMTSWRGAIMVSDEIKEKINLVDRESADYLIEIYSHISQGDSEKRIKREGWRLVKHKRVGSIILYSIYER